MKLKHTSPTEMHATMPDGRTINLVLNYSTLNDYGMTLLLDNEVSPRIVACVNACETIENPEETLVEVRRRAKGAFDAIEAFIARYDSDFEMVARAEEIMEARDYLNDLIGSLPTAPEPVTLSGEQATQLVDLLDALASHAGGDEGLGSDLAVDIESARKLLNA